MNISSNFVERLKELISEYGITQKQLALETGISQTALSKILLGKNQPSVKTLIAFADYFKCSIDYLCGRTNDGTENNFLQSQPIAQRIEFWLNERGYSGYLICKNAEIPEGSFYDWKNGKTEPTLDNLEKLVNYLDISFDEFLGRIK